MSIRLIARSIVLAAAATVATQAVVASPMPEVGSAAPVLELTAADGSVRSLAASEGPTVLIFYRGLW